MVNPQKSWDFENRVLDFLTDASQASENSLWCIAKTREAFHLSRSFLRPAIRKSLCGGDCVAGSFRANTTQNLSRQHLALKQNHDTLP